MSKWRDYKPRNGLSLQEVDGELVILDQANRKIHQLNPTASVVWQTIADSSSVDSKAALAALLDKFDVEEQTAAADLEQALERFADLKLLTDESDDA